jgi:hypothetical protein
MVGADQSALIASLKPPALKSGIAQPSIAVRVALPVRATLPPTSLMRTEPANSERMPPMEMVVPFLFMLAMLSRLQQRRGESFEASAY